MERVCEECNHTLFCYKDDKWLNWICWNCGHYESNTPAFKYAPYLFKDLVRDNPEHFMKKYCSQFGYKFSPTESQQRNKTTDDETEPKLLIYDRSIKKICDMIYTLIILGN